MSGAIRPPRETHFYYTLCRLGKGLHNPLLSTVWPHRKLFQYLGYTTNVRVLLARVYIIRKNCRYTHTNTYTPILFIIHFYNIFDNKKSIRLIKRHISFHYHVISRINTRLNKHILALFYLFPGVNVKRMQNPKVPRKKKEEREKQKVNTIKVIIFSNQ